MDLARMQTRGGSKILKIMYMSFKYGPVLDEVMKLKKVDKIEELAFVAVALFALEGDLSFELEVPRVVLAKPLIFNFDNWFCR